ncbi:MAG: hypothetical protein NZ879_04185 [Archaeoglobaceae archaeon]|nr:hypothetical protein [Archaeoglobaceae archaeon]MDW8118162.1 hypothetical protein [Archaeoglobaceae archaeon]
MFEEVVDKIRLNIEEGIKLGRIQKYDPLLFPQWRKGNEIVTRNELAYELGKQNSALLFLWGNVENKIYISTSSDGSLALVVICDILWEEGLDKYECFKVMRNSFYSISLAGVTIRSLPSQLRIWLRVGKLANAEGFNLGIFGRAIQETMNSIKFVKATDVIILTSKEEISSLNDVFFRAKKITDALIKMHEEKLLNCDECDYKDVCTEIPELKMIREKIKKL